MSDQWEYIRSLFLTVLEYTPAERASWLDRLAVEEPDIAGEITRLLHAYEKANDFLKQPCTFPADLLDILEPEPYRFSPGDVLCERFRIVHLIGKGGMGEVYKAWDQESEEYVALKTLRLGISTHEVFTSRFRKESRWGRKVTHPNVCRIHDSFRHQVGGGDFISIVSMELLQGQTLAEHLKEKGRLSAEEALPLIRQIISGLGAIHAAGILHRDLKPANLVLMTGTASAAIVGGNPKEVTEKKGIGDFQVKITDFGIAGQIPEMLSPSLPSEASRFLGTPDYMAPEQLEHGEASIRSDIYALGLILYQMVTGEKPFAGAAWKRVTSAPPSPRKAAPGLPENWKHTILCCLEKDPAKRPRSAESVIALLNMHPKRKWPIYAATTAVLIFLTALAAWDLRPRLIDNPLPHRIDPDAQAAVDIARVSISNLSQEGFKKGVEEYKRAIDLDTKWAVPRAELAYAYASASNAGYKISENPSSDAREAALEAIKLDHNLPKAYGALAWTQSLDFDEWPKAESTFQIALLLDTKDGHIHYWFGVHLRKKGKFKEAEEEDMQAMRLTRSADPQVWSELTFLYWTSGQIDRMREHMQEQLKVFPNFSLTRLLHARLLKLDGNYKEAAEELWLAEKLTAKPLTVLVEKASLEEYEKKFAAARRDIAQIEKAARNGSEIDGLLLAGDYAALQENDAAFRALDEAYGRKDNTLLSLATSPVIAPLRKDPRYLSLLRRLHFAD